MKITVKDVKEYQSKRDSIKTIGEFKQLGRDLRDKFSLTDKEAIDILNNKGDAILDILAKSEKLE